MSNDKSWSRRGWMEEVAESGGWEGHARQKRLEVLAELGTELAEMKEQTPSAYNLFYQNLRDFSRSIAQSSGIASAVNRFQTAMTAGIRVGQAKLDFMIGKMMHTNPMLNDFLNFINSLTMEIERAMQENWVGSTIFGLFGAALSTYYMGNPAIGYQIGGLFGGALEAYYGTITPIQAATTKYDPIGLYNLFKFWGVLGKLIEIWMAGGFGPGAPWREIHDRSAPMVDINVTQALEIEDFKSYIAKLNLI